MTNSFINIITLEIILMRMMINDVWSSVHWIAEQSRRPKLSLDQRLRRLVTVRQTSQRAHSVRGEAADDGGDGPHVVRGLALGVAQTVNIALPRSQLYQFPVPAGVTV